MNPEQAKNLLDKYVNNACTPAEKAMVERFYMEESARRNTEGFEVNDQLKNEIWTQVQKTTVLPGRVVQFKKTRIWMAAAASVLIVVLGGLSLYKLKNQQLQQKDKLASSYHIVAGGNKAMLTLANGTTIDLNDAKNGQLAKQGSADVKKTADGKLAYDNSDVANENTALVYNTLTVPKSGKYQLVLPDGTQVWLNSASSLKFPTAFKGKQRVVELTGEAYFEVAKNKHMPFIVTADKMNVEVLGTHFNVNAYADESAVKTTLLEGRVKISKGTQIAFLSPGQQSIVPQLSSSITVKQADIDEAVAWKNGYFVFNNENLESIMRKVSRWYNVDVVYEGNVNKKVFGGSIPRDSKIGDVLDMLQLTGSIHFKMSERRITVMP